jgi:tRNA(Ile)-lysidine synthase
LLALRRAQLRAALRAAGETWIDDPGNTDPVSTRARARMALAGHSLDEAEAAEPSAADLADIFEGAAGDLSLRRQALEVSAEAGADLGAALLCAAGTSRPPRGPRLTRLLDLIRSGEDFVATLAGARIHCEGELIRIVRDIADGRRGEAVDMDLPPGRAVVWDGRFELRSRVGGARVGRLAGRSARLPPGLRAAVAASPAAIRPSLPVVIHADGTVECPSLRPSAVVEIRCLALARLGAARGAIVNEATLRRMAKTADPS